MEHSDLKELKKTPISELNTNEIKKAPRNARTQQRSKGNTEEMKESTKE